MDNALLKRLHEVREKVISFDQKRNKYIYNLVKFEHTSMEKDSFPNTPFRRFETVPVNRDSKRKQNDNMQFDAYTDTLFDYPIIVKSILGCSCDALKNLNFHLTLQVPYCAMDCWHCYNDKKVCTTGFQDIQEIKGERGVWTAEEILTHFVECRRQGLLNRQKYNVLRISGGEPFLVPELITELLYLIGTKNNEEYPKAIWIETNLVPWVPTHDGKSLVNFVCEEASKHDLQIRKIISEHTNKLIIHPCFHGLSDENVKECTGRKLTFQDLLNGFKKLHSFIYNKQETGSSARLHIYPTFIAEACTPEGLTRLFDYLYKLDNSYPLKVAIISADDYPPVRERIKRREGTFKCYARHASLKRWSMLIREHYGIDYAQIPRPMANAIPKQPGKFNDPIKGSTLESYKPLLLLLKSSFRKEYRQELLSILAAPTNSVVTTTYDTKHIDISTITCLRAWKEAFDVDIIFIFANPDAKEKEIRYLPLRKGRLRNLEVTERFVYFQVMLQDYLVPPEEKSEKALTQFDQRMVDYFGRRTLLDRISIRWVLLGEKALFNGWEENAIPFFFIGEPVNTSTEKKASREEIRKAWDKLISIIMGQNIRKLSENAIFCQVISEKVPMSRKNDQCIFEISEGTVAKYTVRYYIPDFEYYAKNTELNDSRTLIIKTTADSLIVEGYKPKPLSKYGEFEFEVLCDKLDHSMPAQLIMESKNQSTSCPRLEVWYSLKKAIASE